MKPRINSWTMCLAAVLLASACAPAGTPPITDTSSPTPEQTAQPIQTAIDSIPTQAATQAPLPIATSRGPNLEATDPTGVVLASGSLQLVEFFRFT